MPGIEAVELGIDGMGDIQEGLLDQFLQVLRRLVRAVCSGADLAEGSPHETQR